MLENKQSDIPVARNTSATGKPVWHTPVVNALSIAQVTQNSITSALKDFFALGS